MQQVAEMVAASPSRKRPSLGIYLNVFARSLRANNAFQFPTCGAIVALLIQAFSANPWTSAASLDPSLGVDSTALW